MTNSQSIYFQENSCTNYCRLLAIGKKAPREHLPPQLEEREYPSDRKPLKDIVMEGKFVKQELMLDVMCSISM
ncbi:MAG: hypothetical protein WA667_22480 [Candidatus Nitrosopolaris sp.]